jgi:RHH-type proline utilization regulon transcriptional repressor/proline dehydrogenase/delta 1-pyrroline-5-carboxylate dehydrogenase
LESLDDREQSTWKSSIRAGNLYINRGTTGAIVLRQPFGGYGKSSYGPGLKAGGPNYVVPLMKHVPRKFDSSRTSVETDASPLIRSLLNRCEQVAKAHLSPDDHQRLRTMVHDMETAYESQFASPSDTVRLLGQDNLRRYVPIAQLRVRLRATDSLIDCLITAAAALIAGCRAVFSCHHMDAPVAQVLDKATESWAGRIEIVEESDDELAHVVLGHGVDRLRFLCEMKKLDATDLPEAIRSACIEQFVPIVFKPVLSNAYIELLWHLHEQSISFDYHRYGNLGRRAGEIRRGQ